MDMYRVMPNARVKVVFQLLVDNTSTTYYSSTIKHL